MGTEGDTYIVDFYPTIVRHTGAGTEITLASGGKYQIGTDTLQSADFSGIDKTNPLFSNTWDGDINDVPDTQINEALSAVYTITYNGLREIYGDRVYLENGEPRVRAERRGDMAVLYHGTNQTDFKHKKLQRVSKQKQILNV